MRYLVSTDGSDESDHAVRYGAEHAAVFDATLEIVHVVVPQTELLGDELVLQERKDATEKGRRILDEAVEHAEASVTDAAPDIETHLIAGRPAEAIVDRASETEADAIFVGHRGLSKKKEEVVGSVAKSILSKASVPVTVVR